MKNTWDQSQTDEVLKGIAIGAAVMLLTKPAELAVEEFKKRIEAKRSST